MSLILSFSIISFICLVTSNAQSSGCEQIRDLPNTYVECQNTPNVGLECNFACEPGYFMTGTPWALCRDSPAGPRWLGTIPTCSKTQSSGCEQIRDLPNTYVECQNTSNVGLECNFACELGYFMTGSPWALCRDSPAGPRWLGTIPTCSKSQSSGCEQIRDLPNTYVECQNTSDVGLECNFACEPGYFMTGTPWALCRDSPAGPRWLGTIPTCSKRLTCNITSQAPQNGFIHCSYGTQLGSFCFYGCQQGYMLEGNRNTTCTKINEDFAQWDSSAPTCVLQEPCDETKKADVVIAIDSSLEFGRYHFETAKQFAFDFINSFSIEENITQFSVFRYNQEIDTETQILFNDFTDRNEMLNALERIPNHPEGESSTGLALNHIKDILLNDTNGARADVQNIVILFTGSVSNDNVTVASEALLSETGLTMVYTVGINPSDPEKHEKYLEQMRAITNSNKSVIVGDEFSFGEHLSQTLLKSISGLVCTLSS